MSRYSGSKSPCDDRQDYGRVPAINPAIDSSAKRVPNCQRVRFGGELMRLAIALLCFCSLISAARAQTATQSLHDPLQVRTMAIVSNDLPEAERQQLARQYQGRTLSLEEIKEGIQRKLRDSGYAAATAEIRDPAAILAGPPRKSVNLTVQISAGAKYQIEAISIEGAVAFSRNEILHEFPIHPGDLFNAGAILKAIDNLRKLYVSQGYVNAGWSPTLKLNKERHTILLTIHADEGNQYRFGHLSIQGVEPHTGSREALLKAWTQLEGKVYDPQLFSRWLRVNAPFLPNAESAPEKYVAVQDDKVNHRFDVRLAFP
jgi:outer membrane translocation and assembly module TamA